jgi:DNA mismatch repair ATPase MutS
MGLHYWNKRNLFQYIVSIPQLLILNNIAGRLFKENDFKILNPNLAESLKLTDGIKNRMSFMRLDSSMQGEMAAFLWLVIELIKTLFLVEPLMLFGVLKKLDRRRKEIEALFTFVGKIDSLLSIASLRTGLDLFCTPVISGNKREIIANEMYHPLIHNCVKNSIQTKQKSILLTGSNMSGKTSFIRAIGINSIAGLTLNTCFADSFSLPILKIHSAIRISDDLMNDRSYYFQEVLTIKDMIANCHNKHSNLFLLDEIFKGTNTIERISAGKAVLSFLANGSNIVLVSTHDIELAELLEKEYELYHFSEKVDNKTVDFDYKLKDGKLKNRNAIKILEINEYPDLIIQEALNISKNLDNGTVANNG